jgi:hypothetical protein
MVNYTPYENAIKEVCDSNDLSSFKKNPQYQAMLEHVTPGHGREYLTNIKKVFDDSTILEFCRMNDSIGSPILSTYEEMSVSSTSLRYIFHSHLILSHAKSLDLSGLDIVEVGGGYGGLCLALHFFAEKYGVTIKSYTIVDLTNPSRLQSIYIPRVNPAISVNYVNASTFGADIPMENMFLISNYCFSEISDSYQKEYIAKLFPKVSHGFMAWNFIPTYNFGFETRVETEYPNTGNQFNKYVYF